MSEIDTERPFADWVWNPNRHKWQYPNIQLPTSKFNSEWDEVNNKWISECQINPNRLLRGFQLWGVEEKNDNSSFGKACSTTEYAIKSMQEVTHGDKSIDQLVTSRENNEVTFPVITNHYTVIDLAPLGVISYSETAEETLDAFQAVYGIHPQCTSRTIHELFRLIIEWAYSYTEFQNTEPMAELCHNILQIVQMPKSVRDELIAIRPGQVGRYLLGDGSALQEYDIDAEMPESFKSWISEVYYDYRERNKGFPININQSYAHLSYPM